MKQQQIRRRGVRRPGPDGHEELLPVPPPSRQATRRTADVLAAIDSVLRSS